MYKTMEQIERENQKPPESLFPCGFCEQGQQDLNPQPTVLETATLPIELYPLTAPHQLAHKSD